METEAKTSSNFFLLNCAPLLALPVRPNAGVVAQAGVVVPVGRVGEGTLQSGGKKGRERLAQHSLTHLHISKVITLP